MEERTLKRLLIILAISIIVILLIKVALTKTYSQLNDASVAKKQAAAAKPTTQELVPLANEPNDPAAASSIGQDTSQESPANSGVNETR